MKISVTVFKSEKKEITIARVTRRGLLTREAEYLEMMVGGLDRGDALGVIQPHEFLSRIPSSQHPEQD